MDVCGCVVGCDGTRGGSGFSEICRGTNAVVSVVGGRGTVTEGA